MLSTYSKKAKTTITDKEQQNMKAEFSYYDYDKSRERIDDILKGADSSYEDKKSIPPRDSLTFDNGFYQVERKTPSL